MPDENINEAPPVKRERNWGKIGLAISTFALGIVILAFSLGYFSLVQQQYYTSRSISVLTHQTETANASIAKIQQSLQDLQASMQHTQDLSRQQEQLINEWREAQKSDLLKWQFAQAKYLVQTANNQLQFSQNTDLAINLLKEADINLQALNDANLLDLRKAIANDIAKLQSLPKVDITNLYLRALALNNLIDQLPVNTQPMTATPTDKTVAQDANEVWWKKGLNRSWEALRQIVVIRRIDNNPPLGLPDEKIFLLQNLHAQMESVLWSIMHRNALVYQASLNRMLSWIQNYFQLNAPITRNLMQSLQELRTIDIRPPTINLQTTLQLFDQASNKPAEQPPQ